ncbi:Isocitrate dehydrogenase [NAD] subunit gamma, mitochondrial [Plecturocebus cupreus]
MIPGDGIGPELMLHVKSVFRDGGTSPATVRTVEFECVLIIRHACVPVDFEEVHVSSNADEEDIRNAIMAIRRNRVALKGNIETNHNLPPSHKSRNNILRTSLDLYANVIHCKSLPGVVTRHKDIDILIVRENTEGEYSSLEHEGWCPRENRKCTDRAASSCGRRSRSVGHRRSAADTALLSLSSPQSVAGVVESLKIITKAKSLRIAEYAFQLAQRSGRRKVTAVHKANIMKLGDGLFLQCCREVAAGYPQITFENMIVDNTTMQVLACPAPSPCPGCPELLAPCSRICPSASPLLDPQLVSRPQQFDVMVMPNLYGNIVNNVCAGLVGGPGLVAGANYGHVYAVFETNIFTTPQGKPVRMSCLSSHPPQPLAPTDGPLSMWNSHRSGHPTSSTHSPSCVFQATRNTGKSIANKNIANPTATLLASCMMLDHLKLHSYATSIRKAVLASMDNENMHTPDIGGQGTTSEAIQDIIRHIRVINGRAVEA